VSGVTFQELGTGETGQMVWAVPDEGYEFVRWSDGSTENPRTDMDVDAAQVLTAEFAPIAPPPEGQAIKSVSVPTPIVRSAEDSVDVAVEVNQNCDGTIEIWRTVTQVDALGELQYVPGGSVIRRIQTPLMAGTTQVRWDGRDDDGLACSNGLYQFRILATNASGETFETYDPSDDTESVEVDSTGISPTAPRFRANEPCQLGYSVTSPVAIAFYVVQDHETWDSWIEFKESGDHLDDWQGRRLTDGQLLEGAFSVSVLARELPENALVLDRQILKDVDAEIYAIRAVYDQVTTLHYTLSADADVWIELTSPSGETALLEAEEGLAAGPHSFVWDGKVSNIEIFSETGDYTLRIVASSEALGLEQGVSLNVMGR
jgi:flagellar hook assembly protein FlgD